MPDWQKKMLKKGLEFNPDGIDSNYFYASFPINQNRYDEARQYLQKAAAAPDRPNRELTDKDRRSEIAAVMTGLQNKHS